jgi:hypothetical protein
MTGIVCERVSGSGSGRTWRGAAEEGGVCLSSLVPLVRLRQRPTAQTTVTWVVLLSLAAKHALGLFSPLLSSPLLSSSRLRPPLSALSAPPHPASPRLAMPAVPALS